MRLDLAALAHPAARLVVDGEVFDVAAIERAARSIEAPPGIVELPAATPLLTLVHLSAAWRAGALALPVRSRAGFRQVGSRPRGDPCADPEAVLGLATSGSTGAPRIATFDADALRWSARAIGGSLDLGPGQRIGVLATPDHGFGLIGLLLAGLAAGATLVDALRPFPDDRARALAAGRCDAVDGVAGIVAEVLALLPADAATRIRRIGVAGGPLTAGTARRLHTRCPDAVIVNQYGCTEAGPRIARRATRDPDEAAASVGAPLDGVRVWAADGRIAFTSPGQMRGFLADPDATATARAIGPDGAEGWWTGDRGRVVDGALVIEGRDDDRVKVRGQWIHLGRVAEAAEQAGAHAAFATLVPSPDRPEPRVVLVVVADAPLAMQRLLPALPSGVVPKVVRAPSLPRLASGKIDRGAAQALAAGDRSPPEEAR